MHPQPFLPSWICAWPGQEQRVPGMAVLGYLHRCFGSVTFQKPMFLVIDDSICTLPFAALCETQWKRHRAWHVREVPAWPKLEGCAPGRAAWLPEPKNSEVLPERWSPSPSPLCLPACPGALIAQNSPLPCTCLSFQGPAAFPLCMLSLAPRRRRVLFRMSCSPQALFPHMGWELFAEGITGRRFKFFKFEFLWQF